MNPEFGHIAMATVFETGERNNPSSAEVIVSTETLGIPVHASPHIQDVVSRVAAALERGGRPFLVTFANPGTVTLAERDRGFRDALRRFDLVLPDGIGLSKAVEWLERVPAARVSFDSTSLALPVLQLAQRRGCPVALVGGKAGVAERASARLQESFPGLRIVGALDGYGAPDDKAREVQALDPRIVICCMGGGVQEAFLLRLAERGWTGCGFTCGGYFDQLAAGLHYYPAWVDAANLRWAFRLYKEPNRLWRRYVMDYGRFGLRLAQSLARRR